MKEDFKFRIQSLLHLDKRGKVNGPMSPIEFAKEIVSQSNQWFNRLARIWFDDENIHQRNEHGEHTGHDTLIIGSQYSNDLELCIWIDTGCHGVPVAISHASDRKITITPRYMRTDFLRKLTRDELAAIFDYVFTNPDCLAIRPFIR